MAALKTRRTASRFSSGSVSTALAQMAAPSHSLREKEKTIAGVLPMPTSWRSSLTSS